MNWITKFIKPKIKSLFKKKTSSSDETLWISCECKNLIYKEDFKTNYYCCTKCGAHHKLSCKDRFKLFFDNGVYEIIDTPLPVDDPLNFIDNKKYKDRLKEYRKKTNRNDAFILIESELNNYKLISGFMNFEFMGGSMGRAVGSAIVKGAKLAVENKIPFIIFTSSGGARMQEGIISLMQMPRTVAAVELLNKESIPYVVVLTEPTTGGVTASFAMLGDITIAEQGSTIGFAGKRVIQDTIREELPIDFQKAEYLKEHGMVDIVVHRKDLKNTLIKILDHLK